MAPISTIQRRAGSHVGVRSSRMNAHTPVVADIAANTIRLPVNSRPRHSSRTEMAINAAIAGANATV